MIPFLWANKRNLWLFGARFGGRLIFFKLNSKFVHVFLSLHFYGRKKKKKKYLRYAHNAINDRCLNAIIMGVIFTMIHYKVDHDWSWPFSSKYLIHIHQHPYEVMFRSFVHQLFGCECFCYVANFKAQFYYYIAIMGENSSLTS